MCSFKSIYFVLFYLVLNNSNAELSDKRLCADLQCSEPLSRGKTLLTYSSPYPGVLPFTANQDVTVFSKEAGSNTDLWGVEINGKRGYAPWKYIREYKVLKKPTILVDTKIVKPEVPKEEIKPDSVKEAYEVVDGTTIYTGPEEVKTEPIEAVTETPDLAEVKESLEDEDEEVDDDDDDDGEGENDDEEDESEEVPELKKVNFMADVGSFIESDPIKEEINETKEEGTTETPITVTEAAAYSDDTILNNEFEFVTPDPLSVKSDEVVTAEPKTDEVVTPEPKTDEVITSEEVVTPQSKSEEVVTPEPKSEEVVTSESKSEEIVTSDPKSEEVAAPELKSEEVVSPEAKSDEVVTLDQKNEEVVTPEQKSEEIVTHDSTTVAPDVLLASTETNSAEITNDSLSVSNEEIVTPAPLAVSSEANRADFITPDSLLADIVTPEILSTSEEHSADHDLLLDKIEPNSAETVISDPLPSTPDPILSNEEINSTETSTETTEEEKPTTPFSIFGKLPDVIKAELPHPIFGQVEAKDEPKPVETVPETPTIEVENSTDVEENTVTEPPISEINTESSSNENNNDINKEEAESDGLFSQFLSLFSSDSSDETANNVVQNHNSADIQYCYGDSCSVPPQENLEPRKEKTYSDFNFLDFNTDIFIYLATTAISVIIFLFGYIAIDKSKRESPLVARINKLEKQLLITLKENEMLQEQGGMQIVENSSPVPNELVERLSQDIAELTNAKKALEEQVQALEKELDTSTEVGMELNRMISEMLNSSNGSETLKANVEQLQRQLVEQQDTINSINETLREKETENLELHLELDITNKKVLGLQSELDVMVEKVLKIEEERDLQQSSLETEISVYQQKHKDGQTQLESLTRELQTLKNKLAEAVRTAELKTKEYNVLKQSLDKVKGVKNNGDTLKSLLDVTAIRAELQQLKADNQDLTDKLSHEEVAKINLEKLVEHVKEECQVLRKKYETADKEKLEINTKLDVLNNYFKEKEAQLQKEITKYESIWAAKEGEATSSSERIKYIQEELQNYKTQNETLKQEIVNQEVALKSQISLLEKKIHENWVASRQADRKLEEAKQEAAQLRNRLTMRERAFTEDKSQNRLQSPMELNGEHPLSPQPLQSPASPPLLYGARDLTKSPPMPGLPFLPPPPGAPFMPPPLPGMPPFMPPPPSMFPDHRPPPLGRMSSPPPMNSRYSPESTVYSGYDRNSPSPTDYSEYGASPPMRAYSPYNDRHDDRRDFKRQSHKINGRLAKGSGISSGSDHSHESLGTSNRKHGKV